MLRASAGRRRADQRAEGELYLRGLMLDGERKSMQPMADGLRVDRQQLQQFVTSSTWDYLEVGGLGGRLRWPEAYVVDDSGFPKDIHWSPCGHMEGQFLIRRIPSRSFSVIVVAGWPLLTVGACVPWILR